MYSKTRNDVYPEGARSEETARQWAVGIQGEMEKDEVC
jgi:hypothetical protein